MASTGTERAARSNKWWAKKKTRKESKLPPKAMGSWMKELVGDGRIFGEKPKAWESAPQIGMDKIRARTDMGKYLVNFANSSTIHGLNHLAAPHRHPFEKFLAVVFILAALVCLILLSLIFWDRYQNQAVISIVDNDYRGFTITQPSMMICPLEKYDENKFPTVFAKYGIEDTDEARGFFGFLSNATYEEFPNTPIYSAVPSSKWLEILWELKPNVETDKRDQSSRSWIVTERGLCLIFDSLISDYFSYEYWMEKNWTVVPLPEKIPSYRYEQREETRSINIITHAVFANSVNPINIPNYMKAGFLIKRRHHAAIEINPTQIKTSAAVKSLSIYQRKCKNLGEDRLKLFPVYTQRMCSQECKFDRMLKRCGCYPHFARPLPGIPICTARQLRCLGENHDEFIQVYLTAAKTCKCLPNCDTVTYEDIEMGSIPMKEGSPMDAVLNYHIDFPSETIRRELLFGFLDFLTSVGGAAGLFLGASVISFVEIIYYATLRLCWYRIGIRKERENKLKIQKIMVKQNCDKILLKY
ncbi:pickpocket protein 28-like [Venturia canescens]|uniref:pickpocket protein 28-like n=1 Tax=Venturia canescens TaxID=32260 RepID=UPI001C9C1A3D|nr:pickpocket protein 28-like [Venturia canescens]